MASSKPAFRLRPARHSDARAIKQMVRSERLNPMGIDWRRFTIATDQDGNIVGCVQLKPHDKSIKELASLVVARPWRARGVGAALIAAIKLQSDGTLWLMCRRKMVTYYNRFGFETVDDTSQMDATFRRIWHLARLFGILIPSNAGLAIMRWHAPAE